MYRIDGVVLAQLKIGAGGFLVGDMGRSPEYCSTVL